MQADTLVAGFHFRDAGIDTARLLERISTERLTHLHEILRERLTHLSGILDSRVNTLDEKASAQLDRIDVLIQRLDGKTDAHMEMLRVQIEKVEWMSKDLGAKAEEYLERLERIGRKVTRCLYGFQVLIAVYFVVKGRGEYIVALMVAGAVMGAYWVASRSVVAVVGYVSETGWGGI